MCGIVAATARQNVVPILIAGLKALEYRGYDSAGIAILEGDRLTRVRTPGKVRDLESLYQQSPVEGFTRIAHTRWATHGVPNTVDAPPHVSDDRVAVVHNGIIENHAVLRAELKAQGYRFDSDTDTEVIAHLVHQAMDEGADLLHAVIGLLADLIVGRRRLQPHKLVDLRFPRRLRRLLAGIPLMVF